MAATDRTLMQGMSEKALRYRFCYKWAVSKTTTTAIESSPLTLTRAVGLLKAVHLRLAAHTSSGIIRNAHEKEKKVHFIQDNRHTGFIWSSMPFADVINEMDMEAIIGASVCGSSLAKLAIISFIFEGKFAPRNSVYAASF